MARFWFGRNPASLAGEWYWGGEGVRGRESGRWQGDNLTRYGTAFDPGLRQNWAGFGQKRVVETRHVECECERELQHLS